MPKYLVTHGRFNWPSDRDAPMVKEGDVIDGPIGLDARFPSKFQRLSKSEVAALAALDEDDEDTDEFADLEDDAPEPEPRPKVKVKRQPEPEPRVVKRGRGRPRKDRY